MRSGTGQVIYQSEDDHHVLLNGIPQFRAHEGKVVDPHVISQDLATILRANKIAKVKCGRNARSGTATSEGGIY